MHAPLKAIHGEIVDARGVVLVDMSYDPECAADIVRCVNSHDALVEACQAGICALANLSVANLGKLTRHQQATLERLKAALAKKGE